MSRIPLDNIRHWISNGDYLASLEKLQTMHDKLSYIEKLDLTR